MLMYLSSVWGANLQQPRIIWHESSARKVQIARWWYRGQDVRVGVELARLSFLALHVVMMMQKRAFGLLLQVVIGCPGPYALSLSRYLAVSRRPLSIKGWLLWLWLIRMLARIAERWHKAGLALLLIRFSGMA